MPKLIQMLREMSTFASIMAGVYVHIPFCASRCSYCDFFSTLSLHEAAGPYVEAVIAEARLRRDELGGEPVKTLYLGGGTPSQLPLSLLERLVTGLADVLDLSGVEEFTVEANPDDVTLDWCASLPPLSVNHPKAIRAWMPSQPLVPGMGMKPGVSSRTSGSGRAFVPVVSPPVLIDGPDPTSDQRSFCPRHRRR